MYTKDSIGCMAGLYYHKKFLQGDAAIVSCCQL